VNRFLALAAGSALLALAAGCAQTCFRDTCGWQDLYQKAALPPALECQPRSLDGLLTPPPPDSPAPATIDQPDRTPYHLSLAEAFATALENGTVGMQEVRAPGVPVDDLVSFGGTGLVGSDSIRVLSLDPARAGTTVEAALSRFDPQLATGVSWNGLDEPAFGAPSATNGETANFFTTLAKPLPSGGVAGITFSTDYQFLSNAPVGTLLNPTYTTRLTFGIDQPLLRGFGTEINQLLSSFPISTLFPSITNRPSAFTNEGILITRVRFDQQRAELERVVNYLLLNVEAAYWNLYAAYVNLYATEQGMRQAHTAWVTFRARADLGLGVGIGQLAQVQAQYEQFRGDRMRAVGLVLDAERNLRVLMGLPVEDGRRLLPTDTPTTGPVQPDWKSSLADALSLRPELVMTREEIKTRQWNVLVQKNTLLPDLRLQATHTTVGVGSRLDGGGTFLDANGQPTTNNALRSLLGSHFNDWTVGLTLNVPLGFRHEQAFLRDSRLQLVQSYATLRNQEQKATTFLARTYSRVIETQQVLEVRRLQREAQAEQLRVRSLAFAEGSKQSPIEFLLTAQQQFAFALTQEYQAIVDYNIALASFEFARGTIMRHCRVSIADGPLPECAGRAVENEHRRAVAAALDHAQSRRPAAEAPLPLYGAASLLELRADPDVPPPIPAVLSFTPAGRAPSLLPPLSDSDPPPIRFGTPGAVEGS
jgi:outer membrane protein TolC